MRKHFVFWIVRLLGALFVCGSPNAWADQANGTGHAPADPAQFVLLEGPFDPREPFIQEFGALGVQVSGMMRILSHKGVMMHEPNLFDAASLAIVFGEEVCGIALETTATTTSGATGVPAFFRFFDRSGRQSDMQHRRLRAGSTWHSFDAIGLNRGFWAVEVASNSSGLIGVEHIWGWPCGVPRT
ncbi:hypothetical protein [Tropicibacter sp. S64]|uniref:hypothetical protein n=1 Tax=Tropicibacter sp. S64 TaxID=3415122 RepID=UPI003C7E09C0